MLRQGKTRLLVLVSLVVNPSIIIGILNPVVYVDPLDLTSFRPITGFSLHMRIIVSRISNVSHLVSLTSDIHKYRRISILVHAWTSNNPFCCDQLNLDAY